MLVIIPRSWGTGMLVRSYHHFLPRTQLIPFETNSAGLGYEQETVDKGPRVAPGQAWICVFFLAKLIETTWDSYGFI